MQRNEQPEIKAAIDARLEDVVSKVNYRITLNNQLENARLKADRALTYSINGGIFHISPELISFATTLLNVGQDSAVLLDKNLNPIDIENLEQFRDDLINKYGEAMNQLMADFKAIKKNRTTESLLA